MNRSNLGWISSAAVFAALLLGAIAVNAETATGGLFICGGTAFNRLSGTEQHRTVYNIRNLDFSSAIRIDRIVVLDANANVLFDGIPPAVPGFKQTLGPLQASQFSVQSDLGVSPLGEEDRPITTGILWSSVSQAGARLPMVECVTHVRDQNNGRERSRHFGRCDSVIP